MAKVDYFVLYSAFKSLKIYTIRVCANIKKKKKPRLLACKMCLHKLFTQGSLIKHYASVLCTRIKPLKIL